jgi:hypothetical protein
MICVVDRRRSRSPAREIETLFPSVGKWNPASVLACLLEPQKEFYVVKGVFDAWADFWVRFQGDEPSKHDFDVKLAMDSREVPEASRGYPAKAVVTMVQKIEAHLLDPSPIRVVVGSAQECRINRLCVA